jgi:hypothetical protein
MKQALPATRVRSKKGAIMDPEAKQNNANEESLCALSFELTNQLFTDIENSGESLHRFNVQEYCVKKKPLW